MNVPTKLSWMGRDVDTMTRDELIDVIRQLGRLLDGAHKATRSIIEINRLRPPR